MAKIGRNKIHINSNEPVWFTSDTHFGHANIIKYCKRPFESVDAMNEQLISNWNAVVGKDDHVFHLGDFAFGNPSTWKSIRERLNGKIYLIIGNHDERFVEENDPSELFEWCGSQAHLYVGKRSIYLNHCPLTCFAGAWTGLDAAWQLFGHVHSGPNTKSGLDYNRLNNLFPTQYDVGVDNNNFFPVSFSDLCDIIHDQQMSLNLIR